MKAIKCTTQREFDLILEIFENKGWNWQSGNKPTIKSKYWETHKENTFIEYFDYFSFNNITIANEYYEFISFNDFLIEEKIIPERWCIKITKENAKILGDFWGKHCNRLYIKLIPEKLGQYAYSHNLISHESIFSNDPGSNYFSKIIFYHSKAISFEAFRKYILEEEVMNDFKIGDTVRITSVPGLWASLCNINCPLDIKYPFIGTITQIKNDDHYVAAEIGNYGFDLTNLIKNKIIEKVMEKEIIGYIFKKDCKQYEKAACSIAGIIDLKSRLNGTCFSENSAVKSIFKDANVLDLWFEPVYKENCLTFGEYEVIFEKKSSGVRITCNGETGTLSQIEEIIRFLTESTPKFGSVSLIGHYNSFTDDQSITIGCLTGTLGELKAIRDYAKSL